MPGEATQRERTDEDTDLGFLGHRTIQGGDEPEQKPDERKRRDAGPERSPNEPSGREPRKDRENRKPVSGGLNH